MIGTWCRCSVQVRSRSVARGSGVGIPFVSLWGPGVIVLRGARILL